MPDGMHVGAGALRGLQRSVFGLFLLLVAPGIVWAQSPGTPSAGAPDGSRQEAVEGADIDALIERIEDPDRRRQLLEDLRTLKAAGAQQDGGEAARGSGPASGESGLLDVLAEGGAGALGNLQAYIDRLAQQFGDAAATRRWVERTVSDPAWLESVGRAALRIAIVLAAALLAAWIVQRLLAPAKRRIEDRPKPALLARVPLLVLRTGVEALPILAFWFTASGVQALAAPDPLVGRIVLAGASAIAIARLGALLGRALLTPFAPQLRLFRIPDNDAAYLYVWVRRLINWPVYAFFLGEIARMSGLPADGVAAWNKVIGIVEALLLVTFILQNRGDFRDWLKRPSSRRVASRALLFVRARIADFWHVIALLFVVLVLAVWLLEIPDGFAFLARGTVLTAVTLLVASLIAKAIRRGIDHAFSVGDLGGHYPLLQERAARYQPVMRRVLEGLVEIAAVLVILQIWHIRILSWLGTPSGLVVLGKLVTIALVVAGAVIAWETISGLIQSYLNRKDETGERVIATARARTLLPLARNAAIVLIATVATIIVLSELGVEVAPLIASAGIVGLAVGFGAQTLVKDIITGVFIFAEGTVQVGDVAQLGGRTGVVEAMTIRTIRLRDLSGTVHVIPYSAVDVVENLTKDFSYALIDAGVAYREDTDRVVELLNEIAEEMREDEIHGPNILEPLEVFGVNELGDSAVVVRVRLKCVPLQQWSVRREFLRRMKYRFDKEGIEIPFPHRTLYFGIDKDGTAPPLPLPRKGDAPRAAPAGNEDATPDADHTPPIRASLTPGDKTDDNGGGGEDAPR